MSIPDSEETAVTPQQADILKTFREQLFAEDILHEGDSLGTDDATLLRFLRARKFNLVESKKMVKNCQHWRETVLGIGVDELYRGMDPFDFPGREHVFNSWPMYFHKTGRPVNVQRFEGLNLTELYKHITPERLLESITVTAESLPREVLPAASRAAGRPIEQSFVIVDLKGFRRVLRRRNLMPCNDATHSLSLFWQIKSLCQLSFQISQDYYPELMGQCVVVNAPPSFTFIWSVIRPWLSKETAEKIDILGKDYKETLLQIVDADNLPASLGGECTCSDAGGCVMSSAGPWMEERLAETGAPTTTPLKQTLSTDADAEDEKNVESVNVTEKVIMVPV